jgi:hypothetical protein
MRKSLREGNMEILRSARLSNWMQSSQVAARLLRGWQDRQDESKRRLRATMSSAFPLPPDYFLLLLPNFSSLSGFSPLLVIPPSLEQTLLLAA